jgi:hypothetical protein
VIELKKGKVYTIKDHDFKIKKFIVTDFGDGEIIKGYIIGEGKIHQRNISYLQEDPEKLKKIYKWTLKQYKMNGKHKRVGILSLDYYKFIDKDIKKEVLIERKEYNTSCGTLVRCINSNGIVEYINENWFSKS